MSWLAATLRYTARRWYCSICRKRTPVELNPEWVAAGKPMRWEPPLKFDWFSRCRDCHVEHYTSDINCPRCGCPTESPDGPSGEECLVCGTHVGPIFSGEPDDFAPLEWACACGLPSVYHRLVWDNGTMLEMTKPEHNPTYSFNYGVTGYDWHERHQCPKCRHRFWISNSSC